MSHKYPVTFFTEIHPSSSPHLCPCPAPRTLSAVSLPGEHVTPTLNLDQPASMLWSWKAAPEYSPLPPGLLRTPQPRSPTPYSDTQVPRPLDRKPLPFTN